MVVLRHTGFNASSVLGALFLPLALILLSASTATSQQTTGNLQGRLVDSLLQPVQGANIVVVGPYLQGIRGAVSDSSGNFVILALPPGTVSVTVRHVVYQRVTIENVFVQLGRTTSLGDMKLHASPHDLPQVVILGDRSFIDPTTTSYGANFRSDEFEKLPVERDYRSIATLIPHTSTSFLGDDINIAGSTGMENIYYIDGIHVTDPFFSTVSMNLPYNFVQEIEVKSGGYEAEYGRALGGVLNVITRSGRNDFYGQAFGFYTNNSLAGEPSRGVVELNKGTFSEFDFGFGIGGSIVQDRLWYFLAYDRGTRRQDIEVPGFGFQPEQKTSDVFAGKLSWQVQEGSNIVLTVVGDQTKARVIGPAPTFFGTPAGLGNIDPFLGIPEHRGISVSLTVQHLLSSYGLLTASASRSWRYVAEKLPATERGAREPLFVDRQTGVWSGGYGATIEHNTLRTAVNVNGVLLWKNHRMKLGMEYEDNFVDRNWSTTNPGLIEKFSDSSYRALYYTAKSGVHNRVPSLFLQDSWHVSSRLTINAGIRWDGQYLIGSDGRVAQTVTDQFQPRVGFTYQLAELGTQQIFGSYGRFYQQLPLFLVAELFGGFRNGFLYYDHDPLADPTVTGTLDFSKGISPSVTDLRGEYVDEFTFGYTLSFLENMKLGLRGVYRRLGEVIEDGFNVTKGTFVFGNPGRGNLNFLPKFTREYSALEISIEGSSMGGLRYRASYVLSRNHGNFPGVFDSDQNRAEPNSANSTDFPEQLINGTGLLPNDRTHVLKLYGWYRLWSDLTVGASLMLQSGTPLSEFGGTAAGPPFFSFIRQRGTAGRTPTLWDVNLRFTYRLPGFAGMFFDAKIILDILHVGNHHNPVAQDQVHYFALDAGGNQTSPNPTYGKPTQYQPPRTLRLGLEVEF